MILRGYRLAPGKDLVFAGLCVWVANGARTHDPQNHNLML